MEETWLFRFAFAGLKPPHGNGFTVIPARQPDPQTYSPPYSRGALAKLLTVSSQLSFNLYMLRGILEHYSTCFRKFFQLLPLHHSTHASHQASF
jgi:hypothetical protein